LIKSINPTLDISVNFERLQQQTPNELQPRYAHTSVFLRQYPKRTLTLRHFSFSLGPADKKTKSSEDEQEIKKRVKGGLKNLIVRRAKYKKLKGESA